MVADSEGRRALLTRSVVAIIFSSLIAVRSLRRKSLDLSGAAAGFFVVAIHIAAGYRFGALILTFFFTSSYVTKIGTEVKRKVEADFKEGGQRNWQQVLANSAIATILILAVGILTDWEDRCLDSKKSKLYASLIGGIIGHYACCNGDTWSSELGILSDRQPRLITTFKRVERGTNGGVTWLGLVAAAGGGAIVGLAYVAAGFVTAACSREEKKLAGQLAAIPVALTAGLGGSLIDSLLGATVQFSGFCSVRRKVVGIPGPTVRRISGTSILDNDAVNLVSVLLTTILTAMASPFIF